MRRLLSLALVCAGLASAQSFDRLVLRPRSQGDGTYLPAVLKFCGSTDWPTTDPECVGLQAPPEMERYDLYWPIAAPGLTSCIAVNAFGQMSFVACGEGVIQLNPGDAVFPRSNQPTWSREHANVASIGGAAYVEIRFDETEHAFWTFSVPAGFTNQPTLQVWGEAGDEDDEWAASMRCLEPDVTNDWTAVQFDSANTGTWQSPGTTGLNLMVIPLVSNSGMEPGDLCQLNLALSSNDGGRALVYYLEIQ